MLSKLSQSLYARFYYFTLMTKITTTKKFKTAKELAAQEYFSIVSPYIGTIQNPKKQIKNAQKKSPKK